MRVLCTGGAGFIGSHLVDRLVADGCEVRVLDNLSTGREDNVHPDAELRVGDVHDIDLVHALVEDCDVIFHLAAAVGVKLVVEDPVGTLTTNVRGTENVLAACNLFGGKRLVLASTSEVYGHSGDDGHPLAEDDPRSYGPTTARRWAYAESKAIDEFLALAYAQEYGLDVRIARLFNTVGPRQTGAYGMVLPRFVEAAVDGGPITVFGDGLQTRCFCHVSDIVRGLVALMEKPAPAHSIYNLGNPANPVTIRGLAELVKREARASSEIVGGSATEVDFVSFERVYGFGIEDMRHRVPNIGRACEDLGWALSPEHDLRYIVAEAIEIEKRKQEVAA